jgi:hypothetical protein
VFLFVTCCIVESKKHLFLFSIIKNSIMKKILIALLFVFGSSFAFSQAGVSLGLKGGINLDNLNTNDPAANIDGRTGYHFGAYANIKLTKFAIQPEILYSSQGTTVEFGTVANDFKQDLVYLNIPVMFKFYLAAGVNLQAGPQFGLLLSAEQDLPTGTQDIKDQLTGSDLSAALGVGWDAPFGLNLTARYLLGLGEVGDDPTIPDFKSRTFQISIGYKLFGIGN